MPEDVLDFVDELPFILIRNSSFIEDRKLAEKGWKRERFVNEDELHIPQNNSKIFNLFGCLATTPNPATCLHQKPSECDIAPIKD
ncbi:hypothetical protein V9T40_008669 [Parthenolecanium corni]|uniref:Uncharacterized protein n=1 Tax=Parthenolecanium corni TaxID=536013 RepID=A0AAN9TNK5_9HEMI